MFCLNPRVLLFACGIWERCRHSYWQKLKHSSNNVLLREVFQYQQIYTVLQQTTESRNQKRCKVKEQATQQHITNARLVIKKTLRNLE